VFDFSNPKKKQFCETTGRNWKYQLEESMLVGFKECIVKHYIAWKEVKTDKTLHPIFLCLDGPGTGKSRFLDEFQFLLRKSLENPVLNDDQECAEMLNNAIVLKIGFENGTPDLVGNPNWEISLRIMYQYAKNDVVWKDFIQNCYDRYTIGETLDIITSSFVEKKCILLLIDGMQALMTDVLKPVMNELRGILNSYQKAFVVLACTATVYTPFDTALATSRQKICSVTLPKLDPSFLFRKLNPFQQIVVQDMGGHGRSLEVCEDVIKEFPDDAPSNLRKKIIEGLKNLYGQPLLEIANSWKPILRYVLARKRVNLQDMLDSTGYSIERVVSIGLFRYRNRTLEVPMIFLYIADDNHLRAFLEPLDSLDYIFDPKRYPPANSYW
jgi:hypothetical protein